MRSWKRALAVAVVALASVFVSWAAMAASAPQIDGVVEGVAPDGVGRVLLVYGSHLTRVQAFELRNSEDELIGGLPIAQQNKSVTLLSLPTGLPLGDYTLVWADRTSVGSARVRLNMGGVGPGAVTASSLAVELTESLADAKSVGGESTALLHDAARLVGTVDAAHFSAYDDLIAESKVGTSPFQVAAGDHDHDARYPLRTEVAAADHDHDARYPLRAEVAAANHNHDGRYPLRTELAASSGTLNAAGNPVDWTQLKGVPASVVTGSSYAAGTGLTLLAGTFSVNFAGAGSATTAARSDHLHTGTYLRLAGGDTVTGKVTLSTSGQSLTASSGSTSRTTGGIDCTANGGAAIAGHGDIGVLGDVDSDGDIGVWGRATTGSNQFGVYGSASFNNSVGVFGRNSYTGVGVKGSSYAGTGVYGFTNYGGTGFYYGYYYSYYHQTGAVGVKAVSNGGYSTALRAEARGPNSTGLLVNHTGGSGDVAVFQTDGTNCARIALDGAGFFNGGTYTSGADFAESVAVNAPAGEFEPGDVVAIDPASPRRFSLCRTPDSPLVAGVVSTKPAIVGTVHDMAEGGRAALADEVRLGIVGIVPTKVCDEGGPIRIGDLLVSASRPGCAKRAPEHPATGTILGKALGALAEGTGAIEVLLTQR
jgi:hypothetical protein